LFLIKSRTPVLLLLGLLGAMAQTACTGVLGNPTPQGSQMAGAGLESWNAQCAVCHGTFEGTSTVSTGNTTGNFRLDANAAVLRYGDNLSSYIEDEMPPAAAGDCQGECATLTAQYIRSHQRSTTPTPNAACDSEDFLAYGVRELKLLTSHEYQRSLEDLLGVESDLGASVANNDGARGGFVNMRGKGVNGSTLDRYISNAETVAAWAAAQGKPFVCSQPADCAQRFADEFLAVAFRGPVSDAQRAEYAALFKNYPDKGMQVALEAALTSPYFLYRVEAGVDLTTAQEQGYYSGSSGDKSPLDGVAADAFVLTPYELASTLSFMLTGSTPDSALLEAARMDQLTTRAQIETQVERLLDSPRGLEHLGAFVSQWFGLAGVMSATRADVPALTTEVRMSMVREVQEHFWHVFNDDTVPYSEFFASDYTFLNQTLADFYGVTGSFTNEFVKTAVEGRGGPIASGAFMTANAHAERTAPVLRASRTRQTALCQYIDPPNSPIAADNIAEQRAAALMRIADREAQDGTLSSRDFYYLYTDGIDACAVCHEKVINPMFGMEDFDNVGRLRPSAGPNQVMETIRGETKVVSLEGTLNGVASTSDPTNIEFAGAKDLSNQIAETDAVKSCLVRRTFRFATGLAFHEQDLDTAIQEDLTEEQRQAWGCVASRMMDAFEQGGESPRRAFIELATNSLLRVRR
jgi:cytochrome c553